MIATMPRLTPEAIVGAKRVLWNALGAFVGALLAAGLAWYVTARTNADMSIQQQRMEIVNQFDETGANLDSSMSDFIDAVVDGEVTPDVRRSLRTAISLHASKSQRLSSILGSEPIEEYTLGLGRLREMVDSTVDVPTAMSAARLHADILENKRMISQAAWRRASA